MMGFVYDDEAEGVGVEAGHSSGRDLRLNGGDHHGRLVPQLRARHQFTHLDARLDA
jgi:hypothetical protein